MASYEGFCSEEQWSGLASGIRIVLSSEAADFDVEAALAECKRVLTFRPKITALPIEVMSSILSRVPGFDSIETKLCMMVVNKPFRQAMTTKDAWTHLTIHTKKARVADLKNYEKIAHFLSMVDHIEVRGSLTRATGRPGWIRLIEKFMPNVTSMTVIDVIDEIVPHSFKSFVAGLKKLKTVNILAKVESFRLVLRLPEGASCISFEDPLAFSEISWQVYAHHRDGNVYDVKKMKNLRFLGLVSTVGKCKDLLQVEEVEFDLSRLHVRLHLYDLFEGETIPEWVKACKSTSIVTSFRRFYALPNMTSLTLNNGSWTHPLDVPDLMNTLDIAKTTLETLQINYNSRVNLDLSRLPVSLNRLEVKVELLSLRGVMHERLRTGSGRLSSSYPIQQKDDLWSTLATTGRFKKMSSKKVSWGECDNL